MGKMKGLLQDYNEFYGHVPIDEEALWDYQQECHEEELMRQGIISCPLSPGIEEDSYNAYMEGTLCGDNTNTALTGSDTNLKSGQTALGLRKRRNTQE